jgi:hypothetical protein
MWIVHINESLRTLCEFETPPINFEPRLFMLIETEQERRGFKSNMGNNKISESWPQQEER